MTDPERELSWGERIDNPDEKEFTLWPDSIYPFRILEVIRGRFEGSDKLSPCPMATLRIEFNGGGSLGTMVLKHKMFLHTKVTGLLAQFFRAIGLRKHKEPLELNWDLVPGRAGYARLGSRSFNSSNTGELVTVQDIKKFIYPEDWPGQQQVTQQPISAPPPTAPPQQPIAPVQPQPPQQPFQYPDGAPPF